MSIERAVEGGRQALTVLAVLALACASSLEAQVGLSSGAARVALIVRVAPLTSMPAVSPAREIQSQEEMTEGAVNLRYSVNSPYRLVVRATDSHPTSRVWVRAAEGEYQEVIAGSSVTVTRGAHSAGPQEREVRYRIESRRSLELPVRFEIVMDPAI